MLCKTIILFFEGKPTGIKDAMDEKAMLILKDRKAQALHENVAQLQPVTQNNINQTINNYNIGAVPPVSNPIPSVNNIPVIDNTMQKVDPITPDPEPESLPIYNKEDEQ